MSRHAVDASSESDRTTKLDVPAAPDPQPGAFTVRAYGLTDPGRVRPANEDQFLIATLTKALQVQQTSLGQAGTQLSDERGHLFLVADGMGGHSAGEHASALAVNTIEHFVLNAFKWFFDIKGPDENTVLSDFRNALARTDARIFEEAQRQPHLWGMGTTLTMVYSLGHELFLVHVGDSRCYLFRQDRLHQITRDHTYVQELVTRGHLKPEEVSSHRMRHVITNVVGGNEPGVRPEIHRLPLQAGDVVLLCSDGLTEMVADDDIAAVLRTAATPRAACEQLIGAANERGGPDNVTAVVACYTAAN